MVRFWSECHTMRTVAPRQIVTVCIAAALAGCGGGGGGGNTAGPQPSPPPVSPAVAYANSVLLGSTPAVALSVVPATTTTSPVLVSPVAAPLVMAGNNALVSLYQPTAFAGAGIACVSAAAGSIGTVTGVNAGVNVKSVAALLNNTWTPVTEPMSAWAKLAASAAVFDGWENCGAKAEGGPSPASTLTVNADDSFTDNVFDGNPSTTVRIVDQSFSATQAMQMLSGAGLTDTSNAQNPQVIRLTIYANAASQTLLVEQAIPVSGATNGNPGYVAIYFPRQ